MLILWSNLSLDTVATPANVVIQGIDQTNTVGDATATGKAAVSITGIDQTNAVGDVTIIALKNKSGVNRQWLIEYYTRELNKVPQNTKLPQVKVTPPEDEPDAYIKDAKLARKVQNQIAQMVNRAEREIALHMMTMAQEREKHLYVACLMQKGVKLARSEDFAAVAQQMRKKLREDDELMLFSMVL